MSYTSLLINTCTVLADTGTVTGAYGVITPDWTVVAELDGIDCRLMAMGGREIVVGTEVVVANYKLFIENTVAITERNRVRVGANDYEVLMVENRQNGLSAHHKECLMRIAR